MHKQSQMKTCGTHLSKGIDFHGLVPGRCLELGIGGGQRLLCRVAQSEVELSHLIQDSALESVRQVCSDVKVSKFGLQSHADGQ